ncbi:Non-canonical purine NTP phosphatase [Colletotrichum tanaceti]|uniref:inosine/xanthosine triphosphatase n=1 Tax=Colletotrichum tanaceti TaxID=1306861 RepID=A0A4U6XMJ3_9PEZI|nr:Non-canonical purine NTP phosphatase [Colletotrichum tanaceti]KAJ0166661.1 Non-canonical purine NTP phosphatase [Colletotrichum tanaceti]TKW56907.1 Non-canonical purine NTP phosphatase [Colletotrichum tanaceti]
MATKITSIVVASKNPTKIRAAQLGFESALPGGSYDMRGVSIPSGVPDQPLSDEETLRGALNRARGARESETEGDYWVGIEGGIDMADRQEGGPIMNFAWIVVLDRHGRVGKARTAAYYLAEETAACLRRGMELGDADNLVFGQTNTRSGKGSVGLLTDDVIDRTEYYRHAVILALIPFKNQTLTFV